MLDFIPAIDALQSVNIYLLLAYCLRYKIMLLLQHDYALLHMQVQTIVPQMKAVSPQGTMTHGPHRVNVLSYEW